MRKNVLRYRLMVGQRTLTPLIVVRIHVAQPTKKTPERVFFLLALCYTMRTAKWFGFEQTIALFARMRHPPQGLFAYFKNLHITIIHVKIRQNKE